MLKTRFILKIAIVSAFTFSALVTQTKAWNTPDIQAENLACTQNLRTVFGQQAPNYCKSAIDDKPLSTTLLASNFNFSVQDHVFLFSQYPLTMHEKRNSIARQDITTPAPIFRSILRNIENQIPTGMLIRLPSYFPDAPREIVRYRPEIVAYPEDGYFAIVFATGNCPQVPAPAVCNTGRIFVSRRGSNSEQLLQEAKQKGEQVRLFSRVVGFYYSYRQPTRGQIEQIIWEQDAMIYGVMSRSMSQTEVINVAISMASSIPIERIR